MLQTLTGTVKIDNYIPKIDINATKEHKNKGEWSTHPWGFELSDEEPTTIKTRWKNDKQLPLTVLYVQENYKWEMK